MVAQFNAGAVEFPCLTVAAGNGELAFVVALLQTTDERSVISSVGFSSGFLFVIGFLFGYGLGLGSTNCRKEGPGSGGSRHFAHQQSPSCDCRSVYCMAGITVLTNRRTFQCESSKHTFGAGVGQDLGIQLPGRTRLGMPSNWTRCRRSVSSNVEITRQ